MGQHLGVGDGVEPDASAVGGHEDERGVIPARAAEDEVVVGHDRPDRAVVVAGLEDLGLDAVAVAREHGHEAEDVGAHEVPLRDIGRVEDDARGRPPRRGEEGLGAGRAGRNGRSEKKR